ncbi:MAG TPA: hypothetical protein VKE88_01335 [Candidatus Nanoarchaeia archaeon]|nr:hypothetical protein [Candidatus Nanoarchaeia archaeon]
MMKRIVFISLSLVVLVAILSSQVVAFGLTPSRKIIDFTPELQQSIEFRIVNSEHKDFDVVIYPRGELSEYVAINKKVMHIAADQGEVIVSYTLSLPYELRKPGQNLIEIIVEETPSNPNEQTAVAGRIALVHQLIIKSPYLGAYVSGHLSANNPSLGEPVDFSFALFNEGNEDVDELHATIEVFSEAFELLGSQEYTFAQLVQGEQRKEVTRFDKQLPPGNYHAVAHVFYGGKTISLETPFAIGGPFVEIESIGSSQFILGRINQLDIAVHNQWSQEMKNVYAEVTVSDSRGSVKSIFKTLNSNIPPLMGATMYGYWDTTDLAAGSYNLLVSLKYNGLVSEKEFLAEILPDQLSVRSTSLTGRATTGKSNKMDLSLSFLVISIIILIIINLSLLLYLKRRNQNQI